MATSAKQGHMGRRKAKRGLMGTKIPLAPERATGDEAGSKKVFGVISTPSRNVKGWCLY